MKTATIIDLQDGRQLTITVDIERDEIVARIKGMPDFRAMCDTSEEKLNRALREYVRTSGTSM